MKDIDAMLGDRLYFKIGEVSKIIGIKPYVLRYWETEFLQLGPEKTKTGQRTYSRDDVYLVALIDELVHKRRYTIEGARQVLTDIDGDWKHGPELLDASGDDGSAVSAQLEKDIEQLRKENNRLKDLCSAQERQLRNLKQNHLKLHKELLQHQQDKTAIGETLRNELQELRELATRPHRPPSIHSD